MYKYNIVNISRAISLFEFQQHSGTYIDNIYHENYIDSFDSKIHIKISYRKLEDKLNASRIREVSSLSLLLKELIIISDILHIHTSDEGIFPSGG